MLAEIEAEKEVMLCDTEADEEAMFVESGAALKAEKEAMKSRDTSDTDIIEVNVSGTKIDVLRRTIYVSDRGITVIQSVQRKMGGQHEAR